VLADLLDDSVEPVTESIAGHAAALLADAGLHGHKYAIDAMLSATALAAPGPVTILTSAPEDLTALCGRRVTIIKIWPTRPGLCRTSRDIPCRSSARTASPCPPGTAPTPCRSPSADGESNGGPGHA
jgi:hypothetical protein